MSDDIIIPDALKDRENPTEPPHGAIILHCGHVIRGKGQSYHSKPGVEYRRPDGTNGKAHWIVICAACHHEIAGDITKIKIRGEGQWDSAKAVDNRHVNRVLKDKVENN